MKNKTIYHNKQLIKINYVKILLKKQIIINY